MQLGLIGAGDDRVEIRRASHKRLIGAKVDKYNMG